MLCVIKIWLSLVECSHAIENTVTIGQSICQFANLLLHFLFFTLTGGNQWTWLNPYLTPLTHLTPSFVFCVVVPPAMRLALWGVYIRFWSIPPPTRIHYPVWLSLRSSRWPGIMASDRMEKGPGSHGDCYREGVCHCDRPTTWREELARPPQSYSARVDRQGQSRLGTEGDNSNTWEQALGAAEHSIVLSGLRFS